MKKKRGFVGKLMIPLFAILATFMVMVIYENATKNLMDKQKVDILARQYILKMETDGYLEKNEEDNLIRELQKIGLTNISLNGTTETQVGYGKEIKLEINANLKSKDYSVRGFGLDKREKLMPIHIEETSTAKN